jgi:hypothetical protein
MVSMMEFRYKSLQNTLEGLKKTEIPLLAYDGQNYKISGGSDDQGIYYFIPKIAQAFSISIDSAITIFYLTWNLSAFALGLIGLLLLCKSWPEKLISILGLVLLNIHTYSFGYVYAFQVSAIVATVPLFLYLFKAKKPVSYLVIFCVFSGIILGISNHLRAYSGIGAYIFISIMLLFYFRVSWRNKIILNLALIIGFTIPSFYANSLIDERINFLASQENTKINIVPRPIWHGIYIGFGYLENDFDIHYSDETAIEKVRSISPSTQYLSKEYHEILKNVVFNLVIEHPFFVLKTIGAKLGNIILLLIIYANLGLWLAFKYSKDSGINFAFSLALIFQTSFGFLVMPHSWYLLGFITFSTLFGVISINEAIQQGYLENTFNRLFKGRINT